MQEEQQPVPDEAVQAHPVFKDHHKAYIAVIILLLGAVIGLTVAYMMKESSTEVTTAEVADDENQPESTETEPKSNLDDQSTDPQPYVAEVGQFTLTLPAPYVIIENWDSGFEGGPITQVAIGVQADGYIDSSINPVRITAQPTQVSGVTTLSDVEASLESQYEGQLTRLDDVEIDGEPVLVHDIAGLFNERRYSFIHQDISYTISAWPDLDQAPGLDEVLENFRFVN
jgi:hypothetical protein